MIARGESITISSLVVRASVLIQLVLQAQPRFSWHARLFGLATVILP